MIHIGIDARLTHYRVGGISTYIRRLVEALEHFDTPHRFTVFHSRKAREQIVSRFGHAALWTPPHHRIERLALSFELLRFGLDVYHSPDFIPPLRGARRHIITVHDLTFLHYPLHKDREARRYYNDQIRTAVRQADHILVVSEATRRDLIDMLDVPADKTTVQPHGTDPRFRPLAAADLARCRLQLDLPEDYFLFVGTLEPRKNIPCLLDAYEQLLSEIPDAPALLLVGRYGWLFEDTMARIETMRARGIRIFWRDNVGDEALPALYNAARALILPSYYEGFGLPALEAMACGTVPIVSDCSSLPEIVGDVGLKIDPHDPSSLAAALGRTLLDETWLATVRGAALERSRLFTWRKSAEIALAVYNRLG